MAQDFTDGFYGHSVGEGQSGKGVSGGVEGEVLLEASFGGNFFEIGVNPFVGRYVKDVPAGAPFAANVPVEYLAGFFYEFNLEGNIVFCPSG